MKPPKQKLPDKIEMQMTSMIDIVFQLLTFFVMSFKIVAVEGDFNVKMPLSGPASSPNDVTLPPLQVRLQAVGDGVAIRLGERPLRNWAELRSEVLAMVGDSTGPNSLAAETEVELDCDYDLGYKHVIAAISAVSGRITPEGQVIKMIEKVKFAPPRAEATGG